MTSEPPEIAPVLYAVQPYSLDHQALADAVADYLVAEIQAERQRILLGYAPFIRGAVAWVYDRITSQIRLKAPGAIRSMLDRVGGMTVDQILGLIETHRASKTGD